jgi:poly(beta-D-mannuronate) lyase
MITSGPRTRTARSTSATTRLYFKAGVYNQNNTGTADDYAQATFYSLTHVHP